MVSRVFQQHFSSCNGNLTCIEILVTTSSESCKDIDGCRTLLSIVWSCLATLVACTWVSVHPNVPDSGDSTVMLALHRMKLMLLAIIAPEIIALWALRQRMVAWQLYRCTHEQLFFELD
jgi:hypothetical protein